MFTTARHWSLSWASCIQSTPSHPINLRSFRILYFHLCLGLPGIFFRSGFWPKFCTCLSSLHCILHSQPRSAVCNEFNDVREVSRLHLAWKRNSSTGWWDDKIKMNKILVLLLHFLNTVKYAEMHLESHHCSVLGFMFWCASWGIGVLMVLYQLQI